MLKNIHELPEPIQPLIQDFCGKLLENLKGDIVSVIVYGSAAGSNYNPQVSNINIAVIVKELDFSILNQNIDLVKWGHKKGVATPLFLTKEYINNSLDVFPIEFSEIKAQHKLIYGEDIFQTLEIPRVDVRLLCEQQIKGKLLHLRQAYLEVGPKPQILKDLLLRTLNDLFPIFRQLITLKSQVPLEKKEDVFKQLAQIFSLDADPFLAIYRDKHKIVPISAHEVEAYLQNFLNQLENLSRQLDSL